MFPAGILPRGGVASCLPMTIPCFSIQKSGRKTDGSRQRIPEVNPSTGYPHPHGSRSRRTQSITVADQIRDRRIALSNDIRGVNSTPRVQ